MTPKEMGYRMPAEWEPHQATWVSWPHKEASWPGKLDAIQPVFATMVAALARSETVHINVNDEAMESAARNHLRAANAEGDIRFHRFPTNDAWCRDHGAIFLTRTVTPQGPTPSSPPTAGAAGTCRDHGAIFLTRSTTPANHAPSTENEPAPLVATNWGYNAWGGKYPPFDRDNAIPPQMANYLNVPCYDGGMILEGGSIDVNGQGTLLTSEACLLNPNRNPDLDRTQIERNLREGLGVHQILWLGDGIIGDDTDGHVDDLARFVAPNTIATVVEDDPTDDNHPILQDNLQRLRAMRNPQGDPFEIVTLPMPRPVIWENERLPASYANFYIANKVVLLPTYNDPADKKAKSTLAALFPNREVIGIDCTDLIWGLGAFHCLTQQVPSI